MRVRWLKAGIAVLCAAFCVPVFATTYNIRMEASYDVAIPDTFTDDRTDAERHTALLKQRCPLDQALIAITTQTKLTGTDSQGRDWICEAGTGSDTINLVPLIATNSDGSMKYAGGNPVYEYVDHPYKIELPSELTLGGDTDGNGDPINVNLTIQIKRNTFDKAVYPNATIKAAANNRVITVEPGSSLVLKSVTLQGNGTVTGNGGVITTAGNLQLLEGSKVIDGHATIDGGGIYIDGDAVTLTLKNAFINHNEAGGNGGGIGIASDASVAITASQFNMFNNKAANGGAIYLDGHTAVLDLSSGTFYENDATQGSVVYFKAGNLPYQDTNTPPVWHTSERITKLNNLTIFGNTGGAALYYTSMCQAVDSTGGCTETAPQGSYDTATPPVWQPDEEARDKLYNSIVVGNGTGCDFGSGITTPNDYLENAYSITSGTGCPPSEQARVPDNASSLPSVAGDPANSATPNVLLGEGYTPCTTACNPIDFGRTNYHLLGFLPNSTPSATNPVVADASSPSTTTSQQWLCAATDMRGQGRIDRCDVGAIELQAAQGHDDGFSRVTGSDFDAVKAGQTVWLDVLKNDLGDASISCSTSCMTFGNNSSSTVTRRGGHASVVYVSGPIPNKPNQVIKIVNQKPAGAVSVPDATHTYPLVQYRSATGFHGQDSFRYKVLSSGVITGPILDGLSTITGEVTLIVAPESDFESESTDQLGGGMGYWFLICLSALGVCRRGANKKVMTSLWCRLFGLLVLLGFGTAAQANEINVNADCSLREAVQTAINGAGPQPGCDPGSHTTDTILLPQGITTVAGSDLVIRPNNSLIIKGATDNSENPDPNFSPSVIKFVTHNGVRGRFITQSPVTFQLLTIENGTGDNGGAIVAHTSLVLDQVILKNNTATGSAPDHGFGGAVYLAGHYGGSDHNPYSVTISNSYFTGNSAENGGAIATIGGVQELSVVIANTTFESNTASTQGGALDLNLTETSSAKLANVIFLNNTAGQGSAIDLTDTHLSADLEIDNSTFVDNVLYLAETTQLKLHNSILAGSGSTAILQCGANGKVAEDTSNLYIPALTVACGTAAPATAAPSFATLQGIIGTQLVKDSDYTDGYTAPHFVVTQSANPPYYIVNQGDDASCTQSDIRGETRPTGDHCDLGAFELQFATARDHEISTLTAGRNGQALHSRIGRTVILNDALPSETLNPADPTEIKTDELGVGTPAQPLNPSQSSQLLQSLGGIKLDDGTTPMPSASGMVFGTLHWVETRAGDPACDAGDHCGVKVEFTNQDIAQMDANRPAGAAWNWSCPSDDTPSIVVPYTAYDTAGKSATANLTITMHNIPPQFAENPLTIGNDAGEIVSFSLNLSTPDGSLWDPSQQDPSNPDDDNWKAIQLADNGDPLFAAPGKLPDPNIPGDHPSWGKGIVWNGSTTNPVITYTPNNKTSEFDDAFNLLVRDNCGDTSTLHVVIDYDIPDTTTRNGGSMGFYLLLLLPLGLLRRKRR